MGIRARVGLTPRQSAHSVTWSMIAGRRAWAADLYEPIRPSDRFKLALGPACGSARVDSDSVGPVQSRQVRRPFRQLRQASLADGTQQRPTSSSDSRSEPRQGTRSQGGGG